MNNKEKNTFSSEILFKCIFEIYFEININKLFHALQQPLRSKLSSIK